MIRKCAWHTVQEAVERTRPPGRPYRLEEIEHVTRMVMCGFRVHDAWHYQIKYQWAKENPA